MPDEIKWIMGHAISSLFVTFLVDSVSCSRYVSEIEPDRLAGMGK